MTDLVDHIVHTAAGRLHPKSTTRSEDVARIVRTACTANTPSGIVLHFHGGLVSEKAARESAKERLHDLYAHDAQAYPIFFVWESGFFEAPLNNLSEIAREGIFRSFVKKCAVWLLKKLPGGAALKGATDGPVDEEKLKQELDEWFAGQRVDIPDQLQIAPGTTPEQLAIQTKDVDLDEEALAERIEESIESDESFKEDIQRAYNGLHAGGTPVPSTRGTGSTVAESSLISKEAAERLFDTNPGVNKGVLSWFKVAKVVAVVVIRTIRRFRKGRAHGAYLTIVEECLRELYIDKIGREIWWERMKGDTADAFREGDDYGGTVFLSALRKLMDEGVKIPKITLVGHSTGAIYICQLLRAANRIVPTLKFNVIFEAPAVTHDVMAQTIAEQASRIRFFRSFGMTNAYEEQDNLVPIIYPASLLYFVSGLLEREVDLPLLGMERYLINESTYGRDEFWSIEVCRKFFARHPDALIWAPHQGGPGKATTGRKHGDFDDMDKVTMASVAHIIRTEP